MLVRALYGHPEAGAHWERHLTEILKKMGGVPVASHPSTFWFSKEQLLLTVYVDDLMLSGPEAAHDDFWNSLIGQVNLDPPEPLDRFLGRHHEFEDIAANPDVDVLNYFKPEPKDATTTEVNKSEGVVNKKQAKMEARKKAKTGS